MRISGIRTRQLAVALSFVSSSLLVSRLSNMFQAPLQGSLVDHAVLAHSPEAIAHLIWQFRLIIGAGFLGSLFGAFLSPTMIRIFDAGINRFSHNGSLPRTLIYALHPMRILKIISLFRLPRLSHLRHIQIRTLPKTFLILNMFVASIYTIGVLCALLAGALVPHFRATAIQLSGIVNGLATIMFTLGVDPAGARITDQAYKGERPIADVQSVVFFLLVGRLIGTAILAQLFFMPFTHYIVWVTHWIAK